MTFCERLQQFLVENGAASLKKDTEAQQHLVDCNDCFDFLEALEQVDTTLERMPEHDAPEALVQKTLAAVSGAAAPEAARATPPPPLNAVVEARTRRLLTWVRRALIWVWGIVSLRWLRRRLARRKRTETAATERPRWRRILTSPKFLVPATAVPSLLVLVSLVTLTTGRMNAPMSSTITEVSVPTQDPAAAADLADDAGYRVNGLTGKLPDNSLSVGGGGDLMKKGGPALLRGGGGGSGVTGTLGTLSGEEVGEMEGAGGLGIRGGGIGTGRGVAGLGTTTPSDAPSTVERQVAPEVAQRFANAPMAKPKPAPMPIAEPEPEVASPIAPEKPRERRRAYDAKEQLKKNLPHRGSKDRTEALLDRLNESERPEDEKTRALKREEKQTFERKKKKSKLQLSKPIGDITTPDLGIDEDDAEEEWDESGETDFAKAPDETRWKSGKRDRRDSGRFGYIAVDSPDAQGAQVIIDGRLAGHAPMVTDLPPGVHRVQLRAEGYEDKELSVTVTADNDRRNPVTVHVAMGSEAARDFLAERDRTSDLRFKSPDGYWANTYVPGDPAMRLLGTRLERVDRTMLGSLRLDRAARQYAQPFDAPTTSALDVYLHADRAGVQSETRMLVQVGIKGTPRRSRSRPSMNVGVVLDLANTPATEQQNAMRALVMALGEARDIGDRFSLVVAGRPGGLLVPADAFKHGPLTVAMRSLFANESSGETLSLREATERAIGIVVGKDDPTTPLGSSVVLVVTPNHIEPYQLNRLTDMAHESAVNGVPVSVVGVGPNVSMEQLDQLTLAGQGNRRLLTSPAEAEGLVDRELSSVSRVIARAVRLRVRLAPGVKLVDVIGSHRLGEERAEQVRQAEQSIDRRMSRNLGVVSDRGEDEDGIQIVIPSYYAGDTHVILLDVVAPGPGPIADVRVRYKDLVYLKNGVARTNLTVNRSPLRAGPLEHNVLKNFLARDVAAALERAGDLLDADDTDGAREHLMEQLELLVGLMQEMPALAGDRDLTTDISMLGEYTGVLTSVAHGQPRDYIIDSLRYAAFLKVLPRPPEN